MFRRDLRVLRATLDARKSLFTKDPTKGYLDVPSIRDAFAKFAEKIEPRAFRGEEVASLPIVLPGESQTAFLFALRPYDARTGAEGATAALSVPVYVEDASPPPSPLLASVEVTLEGTVLAFKLVARRRLSPADGYGFVSDGDLAQHPDLLGECFPRFSRDYRLYVTTNRERAASPDDGGFVRLDSGTQVDVKGLNPPRFSIKLFSRLDSLFGPGVPALTVAAMSPEEALITASVALNDETAASALPSELYLCLRAGNHLGQSSALNFAPHYVQEVRAVR
jgi:hypothetical protein